MTSKLQALADRDQALFAALSDMVGELGDNMLKAARTCVNCQHFLEKSEQCMLAGYQRPPARVIAFGCEKFEEELPF